MTFCLKIKENAAINKIIKQSLIRKFVAQDSTLFFLSFVKKKKKYYAEKYEIRSISLYSVRMWENTDQKNSEYGYFPLSAWDNICIFSQHNTGVTICDVLGNLVPLVQF